MGVKRTHLSTIKIRSRKLFDHLIRYNPFITNVIIEGKIDGSEEKVDQWEDIYRTNDRNGRLRQIIWGEWNDSGKRLMEIKIRKDKAKHLEGKIV